MAAEWGRRACRTIRPVRPGSRIQTRIRLPQRLSFKPLTAQREQRRHFMVPNKPLLSICCFPHHTTHMHTPGHMCEGIVWLFQSLDASEGKKHHRGRSLEGSQLRLPDGLGLGGKSLVALSPSCPPTTAEKSAKEPSRGGIDAETLFLAVSNVKCQTKSAKEAPEPWGFRSFTWRGRPVPSPRAPSHPSGWAKAHSRDTAQLCKTIFRLT